MGPRRTLLFCVVITLLLHVVTYLLNTQLPLQILALGGRHAQIGWLFAALTGVAMILRPQVGGWTDRYGGRTVMLPGAATLPVQLVMLEAIRDVYEETGRKVGMKPAGGIRTAKNAIQYLVQVHETLGPDWLTPDLYRLGASSLVNDILMQLRKEKTGAYQSKDYFTND